MEFWSWLSILNFKIFLIKNAKNIIKFITVRKLYGDEFSPTSWVEEFWHHHISFDTKQYRNFWFNVYRKWIEHNEIDFKNFTKSEQYQLMTKDNKFRNAYIECFNHEPIECIWPETKSECTQEPEIFINVNLIKMLFTKEIVREANASAKKNILLIELTNFRENKDNFF